MGVIFKKEFKSKNKAHEKMYSFNYGEINKSLVNFNGIVLDSDGNIRNDESDLCYTSEDENGIYYYIIENRNNLFTLEIICTKKNKMITGAIKGDLDMLKDNFINSEKMIGFAMSKAIINENWNIVKYLKDNYELNTNPLWDAIRYSKVEIVNKLIDNGFELEENWLAYCMSNDSIDVAKELLLKRKVYSKQSLPELRTIWFNKEVQKDKETSNFVRDFFKIPKNPSLDEIMKNFKL